MKNNLIKIKIASPFINVINALNKIKHLFAAHNAAVEIFSETEMFNQYQLSVNEAVQKGILDANIANNIHTMKAYNLTTPIDPLSFVLPLFHPKYGLYINKNNQIGLKNLADVKSLKGLRILFAPFNNLHTAPCDFSRSLLLLKKLELIAVSQEIIDQKAFDLSLEDVQNIYNFQFIKTHSLLDIPQKFQDHHKYDLAINCPGIMRNYHNFERIGSIGFGYDENEEPNVETLLSYAIILATKSGNENNPKIDILKIILNHPDYKKAQFEEGGASKDYIMVQNQEKLAQMIRRNWII